MRGYQKHADHRPLKFWTPRGRREVEGAGEELAGTLTFGWSGRVPGHQIFMWGHMKRAHHEPPSLGPDGGKGRRQGSGPLVPPLLVGRGDSRHQPFSWGHLKLAGHEHLNSRRHGGGGGREGAEVGSVGVPHMKLAHRTHETCTPQASKV